MEFCLSHFVVLFGRFWSEKFRVVYISHKKKWKNQRNIDCDCSKIFTSPFVKIYGREFMNDANQETNQKRQANWWYSSTLSESKIVWLFYMHNNLRNEHDGNIYHIKLLNCDLAAKFFIQRCVQKAIRSALCIFTYICIWTSSPKSEKLKMSWRDYQKNMHSNVTCNNDDFDHMHNIVSMSNALLAVAFKCVGDFFMFFIPIQSSLCSHV